MQGSNSARLGESVERATATPAPLLSLLPRFHDFKRKFAHGVRSTSPRRIPCEFRSLSRQRSAVDEVSRGRFDPPAIIIESKTPNLFHGRLSSSWPLLETSAESRRDALTNEARHLPAVHREFPFARSAGHCIGTAEHSLTAVIRLLPVNSKRLVTGGLRLLRGCLDTRM